MKNVQIVWRGPVFYQTGYGEASRGYVRGLLRQGLDLKVSVIGKMPRQRTARTGLLSELARKPLAMDRRKVAIFHNTPDGIHIAKARRRYDRIILNTVWETSRVPRRWLPGINRFDAVCVPSEHNKAALRRSGVKVPIYVVPHGIDTRAYSPRNRKLPIGHKPGAFVFVSVFGFQHRKNPEGLLRAYWEAFSAEDNVLLVIKTYGCRPRDTGPVLERKIRRYKEQLGLAHKKTAPILLITGFISSERMKSIYASGHAFVLPTRGEGVGLPFLESLASGTPVIATGWGGQMDFLNDRNAFFVDYRLREPGESMRSKYALGRKYASLFANQGQRWAEPSLTSLKRQMRYAYEHPELCRRKGKQGRKDVKRLSWKRSGALLKRVIRHTLQSPKRR